MGKKPANKPEVIPQPPLRPNTLEAGPPAGVCGRGRLTCTASRMSPAWGKMNPEILVYRDNCNRIGLLSEMEVDKVVNAYTRLRGINVLWKRP